MPQTQPSRLGIRRPSLAALVVTAGALLAAPAAVPSVAVAAEPVRELEYVAMGDSYHSGEGTPPFEPGTDTSKNSCRRSTRAAAALLAADPGRSDVRLRLNHVACSGARIDEIFSGKYNEDPQLRTLSSSTKLVTLSIGGNDAGFVDILETCGHYKTFLKCDSKTTKRSSIEKKAYRNLDEFTLPLDSLGGWSRLEHVHGSIIARAPNAKVLIVGYPRFFPTSYTPCWWFTAHAQAWLNRGVDELNLRIAKSAKRLGAVFVPLSEAFEGHGPCAFDPQNRWLNPALQGNNSFHPGEVGQQAIAREMRRAVQTLTFPVTVPGSSQPTPPVTPPDAPAPLEIISRPETATAGTPFAGAYSAQGGTPPYQWTAWMMPPGLVLSSDGRVTGAPVISGEHSTPVTVTDATGQSVTEVLSIVVGLSSPQKELVIVNESGAYIHFVSYCQGSTNTQQLNAAGGTGPYTWSRGATWPEGLDISATGLVTASTVDNSLERADVVVTDAQGATQQAQMVISWFFCT